MKVVSDNYVGMKFALGRGGKGEAVHATVHRQLNDKKEEQIGYAHTNLLLDSLKYEIEYADGHRDKLTANVIEESLISRVAKESGPI